VTAGDVVLELRDLCAHLVTRWGVVHAVDGVSLTLREGQTLGLVGESGSGKTMTALSVLRLLPRPAGRIVGGRSCSTATTWWPGASGRWRRSAGAGSP
jgi:ABC-type dipeptide/oligopeptide/nickel transport system ATPase component